MTVGTASAAGWELKYEVPAGIWEEALPLGSGSIGAMVWGGVAHETVDLNEDTVWSGSPNSNVNPAFRARLDDVRKAILEGRLNDAKPDSFPGSFNHGMNYQFPGSLELDFDGLADTAEKYLRTLSLDDACARVAFSGASVTSAWRLRRLARAASRTVFPQVVMARCRSVRR